MTDDLRPTRALEQCAITMRAAISSASREPLHAHRLRGDRRVSFFWRMGAAKAVRYAVNMLRALREHLREPGPARPKRVSELDLALASVALTVSLVEIALRDAVRFSLSSAMVALTIAAALAFRRTRPLTALVAAFAVVNGVSVGLALLGQQEIVLYSSAFVLVLPFALLTYGSGREVAIGLSTLLATYGIAGALGELRSVEDAVGSLVVLFFPAALGAALRFRARAHRVELERAQLRERQMLARELHDTVAHHVAAIVIQSQAARAVLTSRPEAAKSALGAIEKEASRGMLELRSLVGALRDDGPAALGPQGTASAIEALVRDAGELATFEKIGELDALSPAVGLALHRIARESLHNARRHARNATRIAVQIAQQGAAVRLTIENDGDAPASASRDGFGLVGMTERATLLGGTLEAGPLPSGGWRVEAVLPVTGARA